MTVSKLKTAFTVTAGLLLASAGYGAWQSHQAAVKEQKAIDTKANEIIGFQNNTNRHGNFIVISPEMEKDVLYTYRGGKYYPGAPTDYAALEKTPFYKARLPREDGEKPACYRVAKTMYEGSPDTTTYLCPHGPSQSLANELCRPVAGTIVNKTGHYLDGKGGMTQEPIRYEFNDGDYECRGSLAPRLG